jgi:hypothetical protein
MPGIDRVSFLGFSATIAFVVISSPATEAAPCSAARTTLVGSMMPLLIVADAEIHLALKHPNNLLMWMVMGRGVRARFHFPPHNHSLPSREDTALDFVSDALPRQLFKSKARYNRHRLSLPYAA